MKPSGNLRESLDRHREIERAKAMGRTETAAERKAAEIRKLIVALDAGKAPRGAPPKTPRAITDGAARRKARRSSRG